MQQIKTNKMGVMPVPRLVFTMAIPLMLSLLTQSLYNIVDSIFVAQLGEKALTATGLAYPVQILMIALAVGTGVGVNALLSKLLGAKQNEQVRQAAATGLLLSLGMSLLFVLLGLTCAERIAGLMTADPEISSACATYLRCCLCFSSGMFLETMAQRFLQASGRTGLSMVSLIVGALTNLVLDPIMIFGYWGCPAMGIRGAAIATVIGQWTGAAVALLLNGSHNPEVPLSFQGFRWDWRVAGRIYQVGLPTIVMQAMGSVMNLCMNALLTTIPGLAGTAVAFFGVYYKLQNFLFMPMNGLGQACLPIIGYSWGARNGQRIKDALRVALWTAVGFGLLATLLFQVFPGQLLELFNASADMLAIGVPAIRIICWTFALCGVTTVCGFCASGLGNGVINMTGTALRQVVLLLPCALLFLRLRGLSAVWYAMWISEVCAALYAGLSMRKLIRGRVDPLQRQENNADSKTLA